MSKAYVSAVAMLARREHGAQELLQKLANKGYGESERYEALAECQRLGLQSDDRFAENVCSSLARLGYGPIRIRQRLQQKHIAEEIIEQAMTALQDQWVSYAHAVWYKKYKHNNDNTYIARQKQKQFLLYRGFSVDIIATVFSEL